MAGGMIRMSKHAFGKDVVCPYYKYEGQQMIYCEGVEENTALHLAFASKTDMRDYRKAKCERCWKGCMIAQMLNRKWNYDA